MKVFTASGLGVCLLLISLILVAPAEQTSAAKPTPPPPLPPVRYQIQFWDVPNPGADDIPYSLNNFGQVVGYYKDANGENRAYLYDPVIDPTLAIDLEDHIQGTGVPLGWTIRSAGAINRHGVVVGTLAMIGTSVRQGFVLDLNAETPSVVPLPIGGDSTNVTATRINDSGDIIGTIQNPDDGSFSLYFYNPEDPATPLYLPGAGSTSLGGRGFLNNQAQVGGMLNDGSFTPFRWTPLNGTLQTFPGLANEAILGMNASGVMCGYADVTTTSGSGKKTTTTTQRYPMRLATLPANFLTGAGGGTFARDINSTADVLISSGKIYRDDWSAYGSYVDINKLVVGSPADLDLWNSLDSKVWWYMNDRVSPTTGGQIMGSGWVNGISINFTLNPIPAQ